MRAILALLCVVGVAGCATFPMAQDACSGPAARSEAAATVAQHLPTALQCAAEGTSTTEIKTCVEAEFKKIPAELAPEAAQCGLALLQDLIAAAK